MPVSCPIQFTQLTTDEMRAFDRPVMHCAFDAHNELGRLCSELIYKNRLRQKLRQAGFEVVTEVPIEFSFERFTKTLYMDTVVGGCVPYELKAVRQLTKEHETQLLTYMLLTNAIRGKLINFRSERVESRFVNATITWKERHRFEVDKQHWVGRPAFSLLVESLIRDWGTSLSASLYTQAIAANVTEVEHTACPLPLSFEGEFVGNQKFRLFAPGIAFGVTTFNRDDLSEQQRHLEKLIAATPLNSMYWVNVARHEVILKTIQGQPLEV